MVTGDRWYGAIGIGSDPAQPGNVGVIPVDIRRNGDDVVKTASPDIILPGETVTYTLAVQPNLTPADLAYTITDTIPAGFSYLPNSVVASSGSLGVTGATITWTVDMPVPIFTYVVTNSDNDPACTTGFGGYVNLQNSSIFPQASISGDTVAYTAFSSGNPVNFYGSDNTGVFFTDDGFAGFNVSANWSTVPSPWINQDLPDPVAPNNLIAMFWKDM